MKSEIPIRTWRWLGVNEIENLSNEIHEIHVNSNPQKIRQKKIENRDSLDKFRIGRSRVEK